MGEEKFCRQCGAQTVKTEDGRVICPSCGAAAEPQVQPEQPATEQSAPVQSAPAYQPPVYQQPVYAQPGEITQDQLPEKFRPLSPWAYFGYGLLFTIPVIGFILMVVFALTNGNINRRNYARSYFCWFVIAIILIVLMAVLGANLPMEELNFI